MPPFRTKCQTQARAFSNSQIIQPSPSVNLSTDRLQRYLRYHRPFHYCWRNLTSSDTSFAIPYGMHLTKPNQKPRFGSVQKIDLENYLLSFAVFRRLNGDWRVCDPRSFSWKDIPICKTFQTPAENIPGVNLLHTGYTSRITNSTIINKCNY